MAKIKYKIYSQYGALNSPPVFQALSEGIRASGGEVVESGEDIPVIWSVLWHGRMSGNRAVYELAKSQGKKVMVVEVGTLIRGKTWRISFDHINRLGYFGNNENLDLSRPKKLGVFLEAPIKVRRPEILIACQHEKSLQWNEMPPTTQWVEQQISKIREYSDRKIIVRAHPRSPLKRIPPGCNYEQPQMIPNTYDDFDFKLNYHCIVNHNSGVGVHAGISAIPVVVDSSSLAFDISHDFKDIEDLREKNRTEWFLKICHTEWLIEEIREGIPLKRLMVDFQ
jgi:hypothetical protein